jgi:hypothetical protein
MMIEKESLQHWIDNFYGYGSWNSKFWFVGYEEGGGDVPEEVAEKFNYFSRIHPDSKGATLCDLREMYRNVMFRSDGARAGMYRNHYEYRFDANSIQHNVWKNLSCFVHGFQNETLPDLLSYQKENFALASRAREALIQLYPLPSPHNHAWYYSWLNFPELAYLRSRALYEEEFYNIRMNTILTQIKANRPRVVLMYGMDNINKLKRSVQNFFEGVKFEMVKAIKQQIPQHHRAEVGETRLIITTQIPALRHNRIETGFDWQGFGRVANR